MGSQVFCHDCKKNLAPTSPRVIYTDELPENQPLTVSGVEQTTIPVTYSYYVCGDCEYERQMIRQRRVADKADYPANLTGSESHGWVTGLDGNGDAVQ